METNIFLIGGVLVALLVFLAIFFHYVPFVLWLSAKVSGVQISLLQLFLMRIRNVPPGTIVQAMIEAHKAGLENITRDSLEAHYLAGGNVERVVHALVSASKANIELSFQILRRCLYRGNEVLTLRLPHVHHPHRVYQHRHCIGIILRTGIQQIACIIRDLDVVIKLFHILIYCKD